MLSKIYVFFWSVVLFLGLFTWWGTLAYCPYYGLCGDGGAGAVIFFGYIPMQLLLTLLTGIFIKKYFAKKRCDKFEMVALIISWIMALSWLGYYLGLFG